MEPTNPKLIKHPSSSPEPSRFFPDRYETKRKDILKNKKIGFLRVDKFLSPLLDPRTLYYFSVLMDRLNHLLAHGSTLEGFFFMDRGEIKKLHPSLSFWKQRAARKKLTELGLLVVGEWKGYRNANYYGIDFDRLCDLIDSPTVQKWIKATKKREKASYRGL